MNITCLNKHLPLPIIPNQANQTNTSYHLSYDGRSGGALAGLISSNIIESVFSLNDLRSFLHRLVIQQDLSSDVSDLVTYSPVASVITYTVVAVALCLLFSLFFYIGSCLHCRPCRSSSSTIKQKNRKSFICIGMLMFVYLLIIGDMLYVIVRIDKTDKNLDKSIKTLNEEIYPKEIGEHLIYLRKQIERLDEYCTEPNSILISSSKSIILDTFNRILDEKYFISIVVQKTNDSNEHFQRLKTIVDNDPTIAQAVKDRFQILINNQQKLVKSLSEPLKKLCEYEFVETTDIDQALLNGLNDVHLELDRLEKFIDDDLIDVLIPWQNNQLLEPDQEDDVRKYIHLTNMIFLSLCLIIVVVPLGIFIFIGIRNFKRNRSDRSFTETEEGEVPMDALGVPEMDYGPKSGKETYTLPRKRSNGNLCCIRIVFGIMIFIFVILMILTGIYYALNLILSSSCQLAHDDQPFLVSLITDDTKVNSTILNVINDCRDDVHFSRTFLKDYSSLINQTIARMMNILDKQIYEEFKQSISQINIPNEIDQLISFSNLTNRQDMNDQLNAISRNLNVIEGILVQINTTDTVLPSNLIQNTTSEFWTYLNDVLESTIDACPLPVKILVETDRMICHDLRHSMNGLWLSVFIFVTLVIFGLWMFSMMVCK